MDLTKEEIDLLKEENSKKAIGIAIKVISKLSDDVQDLNSQMGYLQEMQNFYNGKDAAFSEALDELRNLLNEWNDLILKRTDNIQFFFIMKDIYLRLTKERTKSYDL